MMKDGGVSMDDTAHGTTCGRSIVLSTNFLECLGVLSR
jgi:hypothetical protein